MSRLCVSPALPPSSAQSRLAAWRGLERRSRDRQGWSRPSLKIASLTAPSLVLLQFVFLALSSVTPLGAQAEPRAVLELFTSQGCASCPAADKLAGEMAQDPSIIVLTLPVPYWDYLGWKDTLALKGHTRRQRAYATARGDRQVYTPQVVVNGLAHALGSDRTAIQQAIAKSRKQGQALTLPVKLTATREAVIVELPAAVNAIRQAEVWLCPMARTVTVEIGRGENRGRSVTYSNVVRNWVKVGTWAGQPVTFKLPRQDWDNGAMDAVAVLVQHSPDGAPRAMIGAAVASLP